MNRIDAKFQELRLKKKKAFIAFVTAGDPDLKTTYDLVLSFEKAGADIVELGVPFSDPMADGPTIQASSQRALKNKVSITKILALVKKLRQHTQMPIALMTYYNPVFHYGEAAFIKECAAVGVDGLIIPDLPVDEAKDLIAHSRRNDIATVFFVAPTTKADRLRGIAKASTGFIYYVSLTGVTGARQSLPVQIAKDVKRVKALTSTPVCVGFGISSAAQVKAMSKIADGVIVGSAIINEIQKYSKDKNLVSKVSNFVKHLSA